MSRLEREEAEMSARTKSPDRHRINEMAIALHRAAHDAAVELPPSYARRVAATSAENDAELGVSRLGSGVVIHTVPPTKDRLPIVFGYADSRGQWYRDGSRHVETPPAEEPVEAMERAL
jgi:hypothetical protein